MHSPRLQRELEGVLAKYPGSLAVDEADGSLAVVIPGYPIPVGFNVNSVRIAIRVPRMYPTEKLDLFWVAPDLQRLAGSALPNVMGRDIAMAGQSWTQISWHDNAPHDPQRISLLGYVRGIKRWFAGQVGVVA